MQPLSWFPRRLRDFCLVGTVFTLALILLSACDRDSGGKQSAAGASPPSPTAPTLTAVDSRWVNPPQRGKRPAVVFVHGIFGDTLGTWTNDQGGTFFELLSNSADLKGQIDVFAFGFTSNMLRGGSLTVEEASKKLQDTLKVKGVLDYDNIVFVAHSMGGLVVLHNLVHEGSQELLNKVPVVVLLGTPGAGAEIARIASNVARNDALANMFGADKNGFLQQLSDDWRRDPGHRPQVRCGYEKLPTYGVMIVPWASANFLCSSAAPAIEGATHITMAKPDRPDHASVVLVVNALNDLAFTDTAAKLDFPDFVQEGGELTFWLTSAQQYARVTNNGSRKVRYTVREVSDKLYITPDDTPRDIGGGSTVKLTVSLLAGAIRDEYAFSMQDEDVTRKVRVRVRDKSALARELHQRVDGVVEAVNGSLSRPEVAARLSALPADNPEAAQLVARAAFDAVVSDGTDVPRNARWLLAADALAAAQLSQPAREALRQAEDVSASTATSTAAQALGGRIAAATGDSRLFRTVPTPNVPLDISRWTAAATATQLTSAARLASTLQEVPALKSNGLVLQGDVAAARGDTAAARDAYRSAAQLDNSPVNASRMQRMNTVDASVGRPVEAAPGLNNRSGAAVRAGSAVRREP